MRNVVLALVPIIFILLFVTACTHDPFVPEDTQNIGQCDTIGVTLSDSIRPILTQNCYACHNQNAAAFSGGGIDLENYASLQTVANNGRLLCSVKHELGCSPMPQGGARLPDCAIAKIEAWVNAGAPNN